MNVEIDKIVTDHLNRERQFVLYSARPGEMINWNGNNCRIMETWTNGLKVSRSVIIDGYAYDKDKYVSYEQLKKDKAYFVGVFVKIDH